MNKLIKMGVISLVTVSLAGGTFGTAVTLSDNYTVSAAKHHVKNINNNDLTTGYSEDSLKPGYYKTDVEFTNQNTWSNKKGHKIVAVKSTQQDDILLFATKKQVNKLQDGTKATVTLHAKSEKIDGEQQTDFYITKLNITSGGTSAKAKAKQTHQKLIDALSAKKDELNQSSQQSVGVDVINDMNEVTEHSYNVYLDPAAIDGNDTEVKALITSINTALVHTAKDNGDVAPNMEYYVGNMKVAVNKAFNLDQIKMKN
ncbi:hypothetical protein [Weissella bombi]|uniref:hypothetical protein n=1 Tax=Weissella bombi TaxID=1505725 RepID=UPI003AF28A1A